MKTIFGNAKIDDGYYMITSRKEGYHGKFLHRLIFEKEYGEIPKGFVIHHKDGNKLNNCIGNLELMTHKSHSKLHNTGENNPMFKIKHPLKTMKKMSEKQNTTGYFRVYKSKEKQYKQGFIYVYQYFDENKKRKRIKSTSLSKLENKVKSKKLEWIKF